jgi:hypothetical protein
MDLAEFGTLAVMLALYAAVSSPVWVPFVAIAYAVGRRKFSLLFLFGAITAEACALGVLMFFAWLFTHAVTGL